MKPTDPLVLSEGIILFPVAELDPAMRASIGAVEGDYCLTKPNSRRTTRVIEGAGAQLLEEFRNPSSVPDAITRFSRKSGLAPGKVLELSFEFLSNMVRDEFLEPTSTVARSKGPVETAGGWQVLEPLRLLEDTEVYLVSSSLEDRAVLKFVRPDADRWIRRALTNEARVLRKLDGAGAPRLLEDGCSGDSPYIVMAWRRGLPSLLAAAQLRRPWVPNAKERLAKICTRLADAYVELHARGVLHGDVQPTNVLVDLETDTVSLIDFGLAADVNNSSLQTAPRGGVHAFYSPETARALLAGEPHPPPTTAGEQYAVAALLYKLFSGHDYIEQRLDPTAWYQAVNSLSPRPFVRLGIPPWPSLEAALSRGLAKDPSQRYPSMIAFRNEVDAAVAVEPADVAPRTSRVWQPPGVFNIVLTRLTDPDDVRLRPLSRPSANLNYGATGIAYFLYRASGILERPDLFAAADLWIERARREALSPADAFYDDARGLSEDTVGRSAVYHSAVGMHCVDALIACSANQQQRLREAIDRFIATAEVPERRADLTTGYAGHLIACAALLEALAALGYDEERERVIALAQRRRDDLLAVWGPVDRELPGTSESFFGIAHGWAGAAYAMLRFADATSETVPDTVTGTLRELARAAIVVDGAASWPMGSRKDVWTGWCHGSAGYALLWAQAHRSIDVNEFLELAVMAGEHAWASSLPESGHLCCGAAGQVYAFLALHRLTGKGMYVDRARRRLEHAVGFIGTHGMSPNSLYKGDLGVALLETEIADPCLAAMPMFEPERWP
jgi:serine/threonine-protein kinase